MNESPRPYAFYFGNRLIQAPFLASVILLAMWQISLFQYTLKWDAIDITLPWRYFVSDALFNNGQIPWWNPFQHHGFAQGLSLESWYPLALLLGFAHSYDLYSLNLEYLIHLFIASFGFYRLARVLGIQHQGSFWGALVFPLSGFFIGNAQHTGWIASGAWIPLMIASFLCWLEVQNLKNTINIIIISFCLLSGGYIAYSIVTAYILAGLWINHFLLKLKSNHARQLFFINTTRLLLGVLTALSILLIALWGLKQEIDRGAGLSGDAIYKGSLYFKHLISFLLPFCTVKGDFSYWQGDQSMMNLYLGLPALLLLFLSLRRLGQSYYRFWWSMVGLSLCLALAAELPLRRWFNVLPLFDLFRFPSLFRYFTILSLILIASKMIGDHPYPNDDASRLRHLVLKVAQFLLALLILALIIMILREPERMGHLIRLKINSVSEAVVFQLGIHIFLISAFIYASKALAARFTFFQILLIFTAVDLIISCQLNGRVSVFSEYPFREMEVCIKQLPKGYPIPPLTDAIGSNDDGALQSGAIYRNTNTFYKRFGWSGYTPYQYQSYIEFETTSFYNKALSLPAIFVSQPFSLAEGEDFDASDPILNLAPEQFSIIDFGPNQITAVVNLPDRSGIVYNQNLTDQWKVFINQKEAPLIRIDHSLMGVHLPAGSHQVRFQFIPGRLLNGLYISLVTLCLSLLVFLWINRRSGALQLIFLVCLFPLILKLLTSCSELKPSQTTKITNLIDEEDHLSSPLDREVIQDRFFDFSDMERFKQIMENQRKPFSYKSRNTCAPESIIFNDYLRKHLMVTDSTDDITYTVYQCDPKYQEMIYHMINRFEVYIPGWRNLGTNLRSDKNNIYQSLSGVDYSATFQLDLRTVRWSQTDRINISLDFRGQGPGEASLIFSLQDEHQSDLVWKSQSIKLDADGAPGWKKQDWQLPVEKDWNKAHYLNVYIWNKAKTKLEIDNIGVSLSGLVDDN